MALLLSGASQSTRMVVPVVRGDVGECGGLQMHGLIARGCTFPCVPSETRRVTKGCCLTSAVLVSLMRRL
eukprot:3000955-Rhodomonas_salina.1